MENDAIAKQLFLCACKAQALRMSRGKTDDVTTVSHGDFDKLTDEVKDNFRAMGKWVHDNFEFVIKT